MSLVITGNKSNVTSPLSATVTALANNGSGAIRVTTSAPHYFGNGDLVDMSASPAVGLFTIAVIDATHFDLVGSGYSTTGSGTATDLSLTPQILVPTDGDTASLQLSGFLSALQALADRSQYLRYLMSQRAIQAAGYTSSASNVAIPPGATAMLILAAGGGGGGGGGCGGISGTTNRQYLGGGGGAGAPLAVCYRAISGYTALDVVIGAGGTGGNGGGGNVCGYQGADGGTTTVAQHGLGAFLSATGGAGGGGGGGVGGGTPIYATPSSPPVWTPGGRGPAGMNRSGPQSGTSPGPAQLINITNISQAIAAAAVWPAAIYTDPRGQMDWNEGGGSVVYGANGTYSAALSYAGAPDVGGGAGGAAGSAGLASGSYLGGGGGGGGGGGASNSGNTGILGTGGAGGAGGAANASGNGTAGAVGGNGNLTAGGGGGGGGGSASGSEGSGNAGGNGGNGFVTILYFGVSSTP